MSQNLFSIKNLVCAYKKGKKIVLTVPGLDIPKNKLIIIFGHSGSGKSTLLETLGLMNETISGGEVNFNPNNNPDKNEPIPFSELWQNKAYKKISGIRRDHFSFIFQNTNLMPNFTALENVMLTQMIKGIGKEEARAVVLKIMHSLRLENVTSNEETKELSGGERQRLAFIRAITPTFTVLFGDEPTGNLDPFLSEHLMEMLKKKLKDHDKSVIVVSHNIELSLKYADMIIVITSTGSQSPCTILEENIFRKHDSDSSWVDNHSRPVPDIDQKIFTLISTTPGL